MPWHQEKTINLVMRCDELGSAWSMVSKRFLWNPPKESYYIILLCIYNVITYYIILYHNIWDHIIYNHMYKFMIPWNICNFLELSHAIALTALPLPNSSASPGCQYLKGCSLGKGEVPWEQLQNSWLPAIPVVSLMFRPQPLFPWYNESTILDDSIVQTYSKPMRTL